jgi:hypothetical protein
MVYVDPRKFAALACFAVAAVFMAPLAHGQAVAVAEVNGVVSDTSGRVMPNVEVSMIQAETLAAHGTLTNLLGRFVIGNLPPGPYILNAKATGFKDYRQTGIVLEVARRSPSMSH